MIHFTRTSSIAPGKLAPALAFAREMTDYLQTAYGSDIQILMPVGGNPHRISWRGSYADLAALEQFQARTMADAKYLAILAKGADVFIAGSVSDEIWRTL
jgi:hypothetical protein